jgi:hypothetical protein
MFLGHCPEVLSSGLVAKSVRIYPLPLPGKNISITFQLNFASPLAVGAMLVRPEPFSGSFSQNFKDLARDTYKNATLEKIAFLQHLTQREKVLEAQLSMWNISLSVGEVSIS